MNLLSANRSSSPDYNPEAAARHALALTAKARDSAALSVAVPEGKQLLGEVATELERVRGASALSERGAKVQERILTMLYGQTSEAAAMQAVVGAETAITAHSSALFAGALAALTNLEQQLTSAPPQAAGVATRIASKADSARELETLLASKPRHGVAATDGVKHVANPIARRIVETMLANVGIRVNPSDPKPYDIKVNDNRVYSAMLKNGELALGETYMKGWWDCEALDQLFAKMLTAKLDRNPLRLAIAAISRPMRALEFAASYLVNGQTVEQSKTVGKEHYDLGNDVFRAMLGNETMAYTCAYWQHGTVNAARTLEEAQRAKFELLARKLDLKPGMTVLDIGCGSGGFAEYLARFYGVSVVGLTISEEQQREAALRCADLPVDIRTQDYRHLGDEKFDRIVSVGMLEHVGHQNLGEYMRVASAALKPGGTFVLHSITSKTFQASTNAWNGKYIFPGGNLPTTANMLKAAAKSGFKCQDLHQFGRDYDHTLMAWRENLKKDYPQLASIYGPTVARMMDFYLLSCAGGFRAADELDPGPDQRGRDMDLTHLVLVNGELDPTYQPVRNIEIPAPYGV